MTPVHDKTDEDSGKGAMSRTIGIALFASFCASSIAYGVGVLIGEGAAYHRGYNAGINAAMDMIAEESRKAASRPVGPDQITAGAAVIYTGEGGSYLSGCSTEPEMSLPPCPPGKTCEFDKETGQMRVSD